MVLNSDSESVLVKGLRRFASQIRRDHGLLHEAVDTRPPHTSDEESSDGDDSGGTDEEDNEGTRTPIELEGDEGEEEEEKGRVGEGLLAERRPLEGRSIDGGTERSPLVEEGGKRTAALAGALDTGEAAGLLGEYLRGSPQLHDLFSLWDLDVRKVKTLSIFLFLCRTYYKILPKISVFRVFSSSFFPLFKNVSCPVYLLFFHVRT